MHLKKLGLISSYWRWTGRHGSAGCSDLMPRSWSMFLSFMLFCALNLSFLCVFTFIIPLFSPICIISRSTMIQNNVSMAKGQFFHHYGALLSPWCCAVSQCDRNTVNLPLYTVTTYILQTPSSFFTIVHRVCVFPGDAASHWVDIYGLTGGVINCRKLLLVSVRVTVSD